MIWDALLVLSVAWLSYRMYLINLIPKEVLEERLGYDIPPTPEVSIAGVRARSLLLYFLNAQESQTGAIKHTVQVNGIEIGEIGRGDTSIEIHGLKPGHFYVIRIFATNTSKITTTGPPIRVQTRHVHVAGERATNDKDDHTEAAGIRTSSSSFELIASPSSIKDTGTIPQTNSRSSNARRSTGQNVDPGANQGTESADTDEDESPENIQRLTEKLESLKRQKEEVDRQIEDEEAEAKNHHIELTKDRDRLKQLVKEKEEASADLRKQGNQLDKINRAAQSRRATKEKQLQQKRAERQKTRNDVERWNREIREMNRDTEEMKRELDRVNATKEKDLAEIRKAIAEDHAVIRTLEEDIRVNGAEIKVLEQKREELNNGGMDEQEWARAQKAKDELWEANHQVMQANLGSMWQTLQQSKLEEQAAEDHLNWWIAKRAQNPEHFAPIQALEPPASAVSAASMQRQRSRRSRQNISRTSTHSSSGFQGAPSPFGSTSAIPQPYSSPSYFSTSNGMANIAGSEQTGVSRAEAGLLTGGAILSPGAQELLPSNLFRDDDSVNQDRLTTPAREPFGGTSGDAFLGHTLSNSDASMAPPRTPVSAGSLGGSIFSSPHDSMSNLHGYPIRGDGFGDDQHSIHSTHAPPIPSIASEYNPLAGGRLASLFSSTFTRQRGKSGTQEPPLLGTLKQGHSQSFPRNLEQEGVDPVANRRRRGSYGWAKPMAGLLARNTTTPEDNGLLTARAGSGQNSRLHMSRSKFDSLDSTSYTERPSRPSSTYSFDQPYGRPSSESQHVWGAFGDNMPNRNSPLGANWATSQGPWSHAPSRRTSIHHESTTNLSIGSTPLDPEDMSRSLSKQRAEQAPIGTRPQSSQRPVTPKLNPAAPSFKTLFGRGDTRRAAKPDKGRQMESYGDQSFDNDYDLIEEGSPPHNPRLSRDAQSVTTAASTADSGDSFERTTSASPSDVTAPPGPKESLMQKITRKSSSSKFNVPWSKDRGLFSKRTGDPSTEIDEDNSSEGQLGRSVDSAASTPQLERSGRGSLSWTSIRRKSKKGDAAERGSEVGDEDD